MMLFAFIIYQIPTAAEDKITADRYESMTADFEPEKLIRDGDVFIMNEFFCRRLCSTHALGHIESLKFSIFKLLSKM